MKRGMCIIGIILSIIFVFGTIGACDCDTISLTQAIVQIILGAVVFIFCMYLIDIDHARARRRCYHGKRKNL